MPWSLLYGDAPASMVLSILVSIRVQQRSTWRVSISESTLCETGYICDLLPLKRIDEEAFLTWIINSNRLLDYTFGNSLLFVCNFLECKGKNNFHCLNKLNNSEQVSVKTGFMRRFMEYSHCMKTALGSVQRTRLVQWETMGSGPLPLCWTSFNIST